MLKRMMMIAVVGLSLGAANVALAEHHNPCNPCEMNPCEMNPCEMNPCEMNPCEMNPCEMNPCSNVEKD